MNESPEWDALIQKHLDGQTTAEEATTLSAQIVADAEVRSRYLKAAQLHGALADEVLALDLETEPDPHGISKESRSDIRHFAWPQQIAAGLVAGALVGLLGVGVVWAVGLPKAEERILSLANGDFEAMPEGAIERKFPAQFHKWSGDPAEVVEPAGGNRTLRFLATASVSGLPNGPAFSCDVFQLVDLRSLRQQWSAIDPEAQLTLELSARFRQDALPSDTEARKVRGACHLYLFNAAPESIGKDWPMALRDAVAVGSKGVILVPGQESVEVSASCLLAPEATVAVIHLAANPNLENYTLAALGDCFVDDVQLTLTSSPKLPVRVVK